MSRLVVPRVRTPLATAELSSVLHDAHHAALAQCCPEDRLATAWAHCVHEHGRLKNEGTEVLDNFCNNHFGHRDASLEERADPRLDLFVSGRECEGERCDYRAVHVRVAYATAEAGAAAYWQAMAGRWIDAFAVMHDPEAFARELKRAGYYTGSETAYVASLVSLAREWRRRRAELAPWLTS